MNERAQKVRRTGFARRAAQAAAIVGIVMNLSACETMLAVADFGLTMAEVALGAQTSSNYSRPATYSTPSYSATSSAAKRVTSYPQSGGSQQSPGISRPSIASTTGSNNDHAKLANCITIDRRSNSLADFAINNCNVKLMVKWADERHCSGARCAVTIGAHGKQSISKTKGRVRFAACVYPRIVTGFTGLNDNTYGCQ